MENDSNGGQSQVMKQKKRCFVVSEFGRDEPTRRERTQMLKHLVRKVLKPMGYDVQRADDIDDLGQITHQIIERLLDDELVVADLTGLNPNVFYELAVRHAARKPVITLMSSGEALPFDVKDVRTVFYDLRDPDRLEEAQEELRQKVLALEAHPDDVRNPITVARDVALLQQSADPEAQVAGAVLSALNDLRDEVRGLSRDRMRASRPATPFAQARVHEALAASDEPLTVRQIASKTGLKLTAAERAVDALEERGLVLTPGVRLGERPDEAGRVYEASTNP